MTILQFVVIDIDSKCRHWILLGYYQQPAEITTLLVDLIFTLCFMTTMPHEVS